MFHLQSDQYRKCNVWTPIHEIEKSHAEMQSVAVNNKVPLMRRKKHKAWTEEEHKLFLEGLKRYGKGAWKSIARNVVRSRTPSQIASHAQKYFLRNNGMKPKKRGSIHDITLQSVEGHKTEPSKQQLMEIESDQWIPKHHSIQNNMFPQHQQNWVRVPSPTMQQYVDPLSWGSSPALERPESLPNHVDQLDWVSLPNLQPQGLPNLVNQPHHDNLQMQQQYPHLVDQEENCCVPPFEYPQMPQLFNQVLPLEILHMHGLLRETEQLNTLNNNVVAPNLEAQELPHHIVDQEKWVPNYMQQLLQEIEKPPETQQQLEASKPTTM